MLIDEYKKMKENLLGHPNLLSPIAGIIQPGHEAVIIELARNKVRSLDDVLKSLTESSSEKRVKLGFPRKLYIAKCVTSALSWIHGNASRSTASVEIVHGRLKPSNILFTSDWKVKVSDYGLGLPQKYLPAATCNDVLFNQNYVHFCAPELFSDNPKPTSYSDSWSLGMIFYTLLTDEIPFSKAKNYNEVKDAILSKNLPALPSNTPPEFKGIIYKCWEYDPSKRETPQSIAERDVWSKIFKEASLYGVKEGNRIWDEAVKAIGGDQKTTAIPWDKFSVVFFNAFNSDKLEPSKQQCIKHLVRVNQDGDVVLAQYSQFAQTFSPFRTGPTEGPAYIADLINFCKEKWFYGVKTRTDAEALLNSAQSLKIRKEKKTPFILRLSEGQGYQFCISYLTESDKEKGKDTVNSALIHPDNYVETGFAQHIRAEIRKKKIGTGNTP
jgi:serine/threonine protein kinase